MKAPYVTTLEPDPQDTDRHAFDPNLVCELAEEGDCGGDVAPRWPVDGRITVLCDGHAFDIDFETSGLLPYLRELATREPVCKAS